MANRKYTHVSHQYSLDFADAEVNELGKSSDFYGLACLGMPYVEVRVMCTQWGVSDVLHEFFHNLSYTSELR